MEKTKFTGIFSTLALQPEQVTLSKHVIQRIQERQLDPKKLWHTIKYGTKNYNLDSQIMEYHYNFGNEVYVILRNFANGIVITAYTQKSGARKNILKNRKKRHRYIIAEQRKSAATLFS